MLEIFVTEANTLSEKTLISAGIAATMQSLNYQSCVYKPIETGVIKKNGFEQSVDLAQVKGIDPYVSISSTYMLKEDTNPYISAEIENIRIDKNLIKSEYEILTKEADCVITVGTHGLSTPLGINFLESDLINYLKIPVIVIVNSDANAINQTLLTLKHAEDKNLEIRGVIINDNAENRKELKHLPRLIEEYSNAKILGIVQAFSFKNCDASEIITHILNGIDIESVFNIKIAKLNF
jgi:dethiobiotin synthetase